MAFVRLKGRIIDQETEAPLKAEVVLRTKEAEQSMQTDSIGRFEFLVPDQTVVGVDVFAEDYFFETQMMRVDSRKGLNLEIPMAPAREGAAFPLSNFYFVGNQDTLLTSSEPELPKLLKFMEMTEDAVIEIAGHINFPNRPRVGTDTWNYKLSVRRAKKVYDYLVANGIDAERMQYNGYGNWEMVFPNAKNEEQQARNRRVEIRILERRK